MSELKEFHIEQAAIEWNEMSKKKICVNLWEHNIKKQAELLQSAIYC